jgi:alanyl-tRNA synthetase
VTERLYYTDAYLRDFEASVLARSDNGMRVYLNRTAFYPASGGQPFDTGQLNGIEVTEVIDEGERIAHVLSEPLPVGQVTGRVDWARRFDHMQQHSGQHLLSAVVAELTGHSTVSVHFGKESSTIEVDAAQLTPEQIRAIEWRANQVVAENREVNVSFEEADQVYDLRKVSARQGILRIITIRDLDRSACGGTHVRATGEIGVILVRKVERIRRAVRLEFLCGGRAVRRARADYDLLTGMAADYSASIEELPGLAAAQRSELKEASSIRRELETQLDLYRVRELYAAAEPDATGIRRVVVREPTGSLNKFKGLAQAFASMPLAMFVAAIDSPPAVMVATSSDTGVDAAGVLKGLLSGVGGRGGGSGSFAQGNVPGRDQLESVLAALSGETPRRQGVGAP